MAKYWIHRDGFHLTEVVIQQRLWIWDQWKWGSSPQQHPVATGNESTASARHTVLTEARPRVIVSITNTNDTCLTLPFAFSVIHSKDSFRFFQILPDSFGLFSLSLSLSLSGSLSKLIEISPLPIWWNTSNNPVRSLRIARSPQTFSFWLPHS